MDSIWIFVATVIVAIAAIIVTRKKKDSSPTAQNDAGGKGANLGEINQQRQQDKQAAKDKIMDFAGKQNEFSNDDVQKLLGVSDATVTNYLQELEEEGKLQQVGTEGRNVKYRKING